MRAGARWTTHLCFHGIGDGSDSTEEGEARYWLPLDSLRHVLDEVVVGHPDVLLSFDDGNETDVTLALAELVERGLQAVFFPIGERLGRPGSLDAPALRTLVAAGMEIGSHGWSHRPWRGLTPAEARLELGESRAAIADAAGVPVTKAACPRGAYDHHTLAALREHGYTSVHTSDWAPARAGDWLVPRFSLRSFDGPDTARQHVSRASDLVGRTQARVRVRVKALR